MASSSISNSGTTDSAASWIQEATIIQIYAIESTGVHFRAPQRPHNGPVPASSMRCTSPNKRYHGLKHHCLRAALTSFVEGQVGPTRRELPDRTRFRIQHDGGTNASISWIVMSDIGSMAHSMAAHPGSGPGWRVSISSISALILRNPIAQVLRTAMAAGMSVRRGQGDLGSGTTQRQDTPGDSTGQGGALASRQHFIPVRAISFHLILWPATYAPCP